MTDAPLPLPSLSAALADASGPPVVLDGGLGTHLAARGLDVTGQLWSAQVLREQPEQVRAAHADFFAAGAQVATTCSYQVSADGLVRAGADAAELESLLRGSVALARAAAAQAPGGPRWVAASVGPYGAGPGAGTEYDGAYGRSARELAAWHRPRLEILADAGADALLLETVPSLPEAEALLDLASALDLPALLSVTLRPGTAEPMLGDGTPLRELGRLLEEVGSPTAVGVNCCPVADALAGVRMLSQLTDLPLLAYPNSGETWDHRARTWIPGAAGEDLPGTAGALVTAGVRLIGGCCRVGPEQITRLARTAREAGRG
ncbi:homocysteine S-methyltransferase [Brachybacterium hainanense]|uniref:Homocysteine S-methyltransferase n=1 Tax=Brachybacterium hainanense TaxID=1541174 RepID=A0ABV6R9L4_9MICO